VGARRFRPEQTGATWPALHHPQNDVGRLGRPSRRSWQPRRLSKPQRPSHGGWKRGHSRTRQRRRVADQHAGRRLLLRPKPTASSDGPECHLPQVPLYGLLARSAGSHVRARGRGHDNVMSSQPRSQIYRSGFSIPAVAVCSHTSAPIGCLRHRERRQGDRQRFVAASRVGSQRAQRGSRFATPTTPPVPTV
jgi:hypothetical protein